MSPTWQAFVRRGLAAAVAFGTAAAPQVAAARVPGPVPVRLQIERCDDLDVVAVERVVEVELGAWLTDVEDDPDATDVRVECAVDVVTMRVLDPVTGKTSERRVRLGRVDPSARPRLLGLAVAELVTASWMEAAFGDEPALPPVDATASSETRERVREVVERKSGLAAPERGWYAMTGAGIRAFGPRDLLFVGGSLHLEHEFLGVAGVLAELDVEGTEESTELGGVDAFLFSGALMLYARAQIGWLSVSGGLGGRLGLARLRGEPDDPLRVASGTVLGAWAGPIGGLRLTATVFDRGLIMLSSEVGWTVLEVGGLVGGIRDVEIAGPWLSAGLSIGLILGG